MLLHKKYLVHLLRWLTNSLQHILIKCTPTRLKTYEFITEPSLIRHSQRQKELVLSQARSHVSAYASRYIKGRTDNVASNGLLSTSKEKKMLSLSADISDNDHRNTFQERSKYILCKREERVKKNMLIMSSTIRPIVSKYIEFTYSGDAASHVSRLFEHFLLVFGPLHTWRHYEEEHERDAFRLYIIDLFLNEPAFTETVLARLQHVHDQASVDSRHISTAVSRHYSRSLLSLRQKLVEKDSKSRRSLITIIVAQLVLSLQLGDWYGYQIHLKGLSQLLNTPSDGGMPISLNRRYLRTFSELFSMHQAQAECRSPCVLGPVLGELDLAQSESTIRTEVESHHSANLPIGLSTLHKSKQIRPSILASMHAAIEYLTRYYNSPRGVIDDNSYYSVRGTKLANAFIEILHISDLTHAEIFLSTGLLILISITPPDSRAQWQYPLDIVMVRAVMDISKIYMLIREPRDYILWTALVIAGVPHDYILSARERWTILKTILNDSGQCLPWSQVQVLLSRFYLDDAFGALWRHCYVIAVESLKNDKLD